MILRILRRRALGRKQRRHARLTRSIAELETRLFPRVLTFDEWKHNLLAQVRYLPDVEQLAENYALYCAERRAT